MSFAISCAFSVLNLSSIAFTASFGVCFASSFSTTAFAISSGRPMLSFSDRILVPQPVPPKLARLGHVLRARQRFAVQHEAVIAGEIKLLGCKHVRHVIVLLLQPLKKPRKNDARRSRIALLLSEIIQPRAILLKFVQVRLGEINVQVIEGVEITVEELGRDFVVQRLAQVMASLEDRRDPMSDVRIVGAGSQRHRHELFGLAEEGLVWFGGRNHTVFGTKRRRSKVQPYNEKNKSYEHLIPIVMVFADT